MIENPRDTITILVASVMIWTDPRSTTASISELAALSREFAAIIIVLVSKVNFSPCAFLHWLPLQQRIQYKIAAITRKAVDFRSAVHRRTPRTPSDDAVSAVHRRSASFCAMDTQWDSQASVLCGGSERLELPTLPTEFFLHYITKSHS